ncbi:hypothetical protein ACHQM5_014460 [Ranunculus cassubicifolius]
MSANSVTSPQFCFCGALGKIQTSWTNENPCRRFVSCARRDCEFWFWLDPPTKRRSINTNLSRREDDEKNEKIARLESEKTELIRENGRLSFEGCKFGIEEGIVGWNKDSEKLLFRNVVFSVLLSD